MSPCSRRGRGASGFIDTIVHVIPSRVEQNVRLTVGHRRVRHLLHSVIVEMQPSTAAVRVRCIMAATGAAINRVKDITHCYLKIPTQVVTYPFPWCTMTAARS